MALKTMLLITIVFAVTPAIANSDPQKLPLKAFIESATKNDSEFEAILIEQLPLNYRRAALLPDSDLIVSIKQLFHVYLDQHHTDADTNLSLSQMFPNTGTDVSLTYSKPTSTIADDDASLQFLISQPIAQNAFGKGFQLSDKIIGIENDIIRHQIVEAYEDYLASLMVAYYNWYSAYENLKVGEASLQSSQKLLNNILERRRQKIALPIDVNKMKLALVGKQENLITLQEIYSSHSYLIFKAIRHRNKPNYIPTKPDSQANDIAFDEGYKAFTDTSRTYSLLNLLEQQGTLEVKKAADDLLPSTNLLIGYQLSGQDWGSTEREDSLFVGLSLSLPLGRSVNRAKHEITQIQRKKTLLANQNKYEDLRTNLKNLHTQIQRETKLMDIAEQKIKLSEAILKDETENYSFGKVSLNDYIDAVNTADENRFSYTSHNVQLNKLLIEWRRLTDQLVDNIITLDTQAANKVQ